LFIFLTFLVLNR